MYTRPVWAEISAPRLVSNYQQLCRTAGAEADVLAVVKANAYGHDVLACAPLLADAGARWLGVTSASEGAAVRAVCAQPRILLMSGVFPGEADLVIDQSLTPVVWEPWQLDLLEEAGRTRGVPPGGLPVHLEIDTGMSRQGVRMLSSHDSPQGAALLKRFHPDSCLRLEGVMTHFCAPEVVSSELPNPQLTGLAAAAKLVADVGFHPQWLHAGNSSTLVAGPDKEALIAIAQSIGARLMLRPGLALYGYLDRLTLDGTSWAGDLPELTPVLEWKTRVTSLRIVRAGDTAGYGHTFTAKRETQLALLPVGYADGLNRLLSNRGDVLVRGKRAPIAGRVSMDQTIVDVTGISAAVGDEVVLLGEQDGASITAWDLADTCRTIPWEVLCAISARVPRVLVS